MTHGGHGRSWKAMPVALALAALALGVAFPSAGAEENPFLPPQERQSDIDQRLQKRIDRALAAMEERLTRSLVDALEGGKDGALPRALRDAMGRQGAVASAGGGMGGMSGGMGNGPGNGMGGGIPPLPALPPLPNVPAGRDAGSVPAGATFIGCLDGKAFFQDRAGSPFLADPRAFPPSAGGAAACAP